jgi:hypothetical protein
VLTQHSAIVRRQAFTQQVIQKLFILRDMASDDDDGWIRHRFPPGEEPTVYTWDLCAEVGHEHCKGIDRTIEGYEGEAVFCTCLCHRVISND